MDSFLGVLALIRIGRKQRSAGYPRCLCVDPVMEGVDANLFDRLLGERWRHAGLGKQNLLCAPDEREMKGRRRRAMNT